MLDGGRDSRGKDRLAAYASLLAPAVAGNATEIDHPAQRRRGNLAQFACRAWLRRLRKAAETLRPLALLIKVVSVIDCNHGVSGISS